MYRDRERIRQVVEAYAEGRIDVDELVRELDEEPRPAAPSRSVRRWEAAWPDHYTRAEAVVRRSRHL